ncbi:MAG: hypothetical protein PF961_23785 [Planctomycetota bacterium]|jgi:hypothetical protein|nr:hypothetical protein [Planctomycetota bacterium]
MLLAIASDDAAKVWINDTLAWQDTGLSAWRLGATGGQACRCGGR